VRSIRRTFRSVLELRSLRLCSSYWPDQTLVVETDGYEFHRTAAARRRDAAKDVTERPADTAALLGGTSVT
jgi:hypothetical protein